MAHDGVFFKKNCLIHEKYRTPHVALIYQGVWSCVLVLSGTYSDLLTYTAFASLLFNVMTIIGVIVLRYRKPDLPRPYRVSGYPLVPLLYIAIALFFIVYIVIGDPEFGQRAVPHPGGNPRLCLLEQQKESRQLPARCGPVMPAGRCGG